jgi:hypothetical protein
LHSCRRGEVECRWGEVERDPDGARVDGFAGAHVLPWFMHRRCGSLALVALLLGCASLTRPDGDEILGERTAPAVVVAPPPAATNVALVAAPQPQPEPPPAAPPNPQAAKQGG